MTSRAFPSTCQGGMTLSSKARKPLKRMFVRGSERMRGQANVISVIVKHFSLGCKISLNVTRIYSEREEMGAA